MAKKETTVALERVMSEYTIDQIQTVVDRKVMEVFTNIGFEEQIKKVFEEQINTKKIQDLLIKILENFLIKPKEIENFVVYENIDYLKEKVISEGFNSIDIKKFVKTPKMQKLFKEALTEYMNDIDLNEFMFDEFYDSIKSRIKMVIE